jgi:hypothetical protein
MTETDSTATSAPPLAEDDVSEAAILDAAEKALWRADGGLVVAARILGVPVQAFRDYVASEPTLQTALIDIRARHDDIAYQRTVAGMQAGVPELVSLYLNTFGAEVANPLPRDYQGLFDYVDITNYQQSGGRHQDIEEARSGQDPAADASGRGQLAGGSEQARRGSGSGGGESRSAAAFDLAAILEKVRRSTAGEAAA